MEEIFEEPTGIEEVKAGGKTYYKTLYGKGAGRFINNNKRCDGCHLKSDCYIGRHAMIAACNEGRTDDIGNGGTGKTSRRNKAKDSRMPETNDKRGLQVQQPRAKKGKDKPAKVAKATRQTDGRATRKTKRGGTKCRVRENKKLTASATLTRGDVKLIKPGD